MKGKKIKNYDEKRISCSFRKYRRKKKFKKIKRNRILKYHPKTEPKRKKVEKVRILIIFNINDLCL